MSFMKFRQCGCDCRDNETHSQTNTAPCCDVCPDWESPCTWIARFGCTILPDAGCDNQTTRGIACADVYLRPECYFDDRTVIVGCYEGGEYTVPGGNCKWVALGRGLPGCGECLPCAGYNYRDIFEDDANPCSWNDFPVTSPTFTYGYSWVLTIRETGSTLEWDHPEHGLLGYTKAEAWDCAGANTLELTSGADAVPELPRQLCVVPLDRPSEGGCNPDVPCGYTDPADRCYCCDPCCDCIPDQPLWNSCGACTDSTTVSPCVGGGNGLSGVDSPAGQTYGAEATLCGYLVSVNWYCRGESGGGWAADVYIDDVFCETVSLTHECCSLTLGTGQTNCAPDCCVGIGAECEGGVATDCCPDDDVPETLTAEFGPNTTDPCVEGTAEGTMLTMTYDAGNDWWDGETTTATGDLGFRIWCDSGTWMGEPRCNGVAANSPSALTLVSCNPFEATATATFGQSCGGCTDGSSEISQTYNLTITA